MSKHSTLDEVTSTIEYGIYSKQMSLFLSFFTFLLKTSFFVIYDVFFVLTLKK